MMKLHKIFFVFLKLGALTFGGGLAMLPIIKKELLNRQWVTEDILDDYIAVAQVAPGMIAINIATLVGTHLRKRIGALVAVIGVALPSIIVITIIASVLQEFAEYKVVQDALHGITLVVIILLTYAVIDMGRKVAKHWMFLVYSMASFSAVYFFHISSVLVISVSLLLGIILTLFNNVGVESHD